jgi:hypothetical protein
MHDVFYATRPNVSMCNCSASYSVYYAIYYDNCLLVYMLSYAGSELPTRAVTSPQDGEIPTDFKAGLTLKAEELILKRCQRANRFKAELAGLREL